MDEIIEQGINTAFVEGLKAGVRMYAWWKDGTQYVGTCGTTLKEALSRIDEKYAENKQLISNKYK